MLGLEKVPLISVNDFHVLFIAKSVSRMCLSERLNLKETLV